MESIKGYETCKIDEKGRLVIPKQHRPGLTSHFVMTLNWDDSIVAFPYPRWQEIEAALKSKRTMSSTEPHTLNAINRTFLFANEIKSDNWRILVPSVLREKAKLSGEVVCAGETDRMVIRSRADHDGMLASLETQETKDEQRGLLYGV